MKVGIVIYSDDPETAWNAFRVGNFSLAMGDEVRVFLIGRGVEVESSDTEQFRVSEQRQQFVGTGGKIFACGTCLKIHGLKAPTGFTESTMKDMYEIVRESDKVVTF